MFHHECCKLTVQVAEDNGVTVASFIQYRYQVTFTIGCSLGGLHDADIRDQAVITDGIVVDVASYILNQTVVADRHVTQRRVVNAA